MNRKQRMPGLRLTSLALPLGALMVAASLTFASTAFAAGDSLTVTPGTTHTGTGSTFTVTIKANNAVPMQGVGASVNFDKSRLQLTAVATPMTPASYMGVPDASGIATANAAGHLPNISNVRFGSTWAAGSYNLLTLTFQVIACGNSSIDLPIGPADGSMNDANGDPLADLTSTSGTVVNPCPTPTPVPTATPVATPTPAPASAAPGAQTVNVTGSLDSGFLGITVPATDTIPLVRNATNVKVVPVTVFSNIAWNLVVNDPKTTNTGFMTSGGLVLSNPMHVLADPTVDVNLSNPTTPQQIQSGANSTNVNTTLSQFVAPADHAGSYGMQIIYAALSGI